MAEKSDPCTSQLAVCQAYVNGSKADYHLPSHTIQWRRTCGRLDYPLKGVKWLTTPEGFETQVDGKSIVFKWIRPRRLTLLRCIKLALEELVPNNTQKTLKRRSVTARAIQFGAREGVQKEEVHAVLELWMLTRLNRF